MDYIRFIKYNVRYENICDAYEEILEFFDGEIHMAAHAREEFRRYWEFDYPRLKWLGQLNNRGYHVYLKPIQEKEKFYMLVDDADRENLSQFHQNKKGCWLPGRMITETSPGNFQVWMSMRKAMSNEVKTVWLNFFQSDPGASPAGRWSRAPLFTNQKLKYRKNQEYPIARIIHIDLEGYAVFPEITPWKPKPKTYKKNTRKKLFRGRKTGRKCRDDFFEDDQSQADWRYIFYLLHKGFGYDDVFEKILDERTEWKNHPDREAYVTRTLGKAIDIFNELD